MPELEFEMLGNVEFIYKFNNLGVNTKQQVRLDDWHKLCFTIRLHAKGKGKGKADCRGQTLDQDW